MLTSLKSGEHEETDLESESEVQPRNREVISIRKQVMFNSQRAIDIYV